MALVLSIMLILSLGLTVVLFLDIAFDKGYDKAHNIATMSTVMLQHQATMLMIFLLLDAIIFVLLSLIVKHNRE